MPPKVDAEISNIIQTLNHPQRLSLHPFLRGVLVFHLKTFIQEETDRLIAMDTSRRCDPTPSGSSGSSGSSGCSGHARPPKPPPPPRIGGFHSQCRFLSSCPFPTPPPPPAPPFAVYPIPCSSTAPPPTRTPYPWRLKSKPREPNTP